jgi:hypothetical protein
MGSMSLMHWVMVIFYLVFLYVIVGIPAGVILRRVGMSRWWSLLAIIPIANLVGLWIFAFARWPATDISPSQRAT